MSNGLCRGVSDPLAFAGLINDLFDNGRLVFCDPALHPRTAAAVQEVATRSGSKPPAVSGEAPVIRRVALGGSWRNLCGDGDKRQTMVLVAANAARFELLASIFAGDHASIDARGADALILGAIAAGDVADALPVSRRSGAVSTAAWLVHAAADKMIASYGYAASRARLEVAKTLLPNDLRAQAKSLAETRVGRYADTTAAADLWAETKIGDQIAEWLAKQTLDKG